MVGTKACSDAELLDAWRSGDGGCGEQLFERHYGRVMRFFANKVSTHADDLVQQTFLACLEGRDRIRKEGSFRSYLFGIAHNVLRAHHRRKGNFVSEEETSAVATDPGPSTLVARKRRHQELLDALRRIPIVYQVTLELRFWEDLPTSEIAEILGVPHPTARSRLRRARELLLAALSGAVASSDGQEPSLDAWMQEIRKTVFVGSTETA